MTRHLHIDLRPNEEWRPAPGFPNYEVSSEGRVRSLYFDPPREVSAWLNEDGYLCVTLTLEASKRRYARVHRLVGLAFHGDKQNALHNEVAHMDGDRANPRADNLKWVSRVENCSHKVGHGTLLRGEAHPRAKLTDSGVQEILGSPLTAREMAEKMGVSPRAIADIRQGKRWAHIARQAQGAIL